MSPCRRFSLLLTVVLLELVVSPVGRSDDPKTRPASWATKLDRAGLPNLYKLSDGLYRGAQPDAQGIKELERLGVKTIIGLRSAHSDKAILGDAKIAYEAIPMQAWNMREDDVVRFLQLATDKNRQPVFVHCQYGSDRTGVMCAAYRVAVDGWTKQQAIDEMTQGSFGFHPWWQNLVTFINSMDVEQIKGKAGLK